MTDAILSVRCYTCGWPMISFPDFAPGEDRWIACENPKCPDKDKRFDLPRIPLKRYEGKGAALQSEGV